MFRDARLWVIAVAAWIPPAIWYAHALHVASAYEPHHMFGEGGIGFVTAIEYLARLRVLRLQRHDVDCIRGCRRRHVSRASYARTLAVPLVGSVGSGVHDHRRPREHPSVVSTSTDRAGGGIRRFRMRPAARRRACSPSSIGSRRGDVSAHAVRLPSCRRTHAAVRALGRAAPPGRLGHSAASCPGAHGVYRRWGSPGHLLQRSARLEFPSEVRIGTGDERGSDTGT